MFTAKAQSTLMCNFLTMKYGAVIFVYLFPTVSNTVFIYLFILITQACGNCNNNHMQSMSLLFM